MFDWFFEMSNWLYAIVFGIPALAVVLYICRNEIKAWWHLANNPEPNYWERARQAETE